VLIVRSDPARVETDLCAGRLVCPGCAGELRPWGHARSRVVRMDVGEERVRPRRGRCRGCQATSVLLSETCLVRRRDAVDVIGAALVGHAEGAGHRRIARELGRPAETVRGWLRRFAARAEMIRRHFLGWAVALDARLHEVESRSSPLRDALEAVGLAARAASLFFGPRPVWSWVSGLSGGGLLSNTGSLSPAPR
jgi:transposase-like protein